jgi:PAS domain S-box-containing protein
VWVLTIKTPIRDEQGNITGLLGIFWDITERKRAEEAIQVAEERFRLMVNSVKDYAIVMLDPKGHVITWNDGAQGVKGYKPDEIIGKYFSIFYPSNDIKTGKPDRELTTAVDQGYFEDEGWRVRKNGSRFWANVMITALRDKEDHLRGFAKITRDMTERKISEENIRRLNTELRMKNEELEQVLYATSHDLRSPLVNVQGFNKELDASINHLLSVLSDAKIPPKVRKQIMPILTEDIPESIRFILASTSKMDTLLTGLLQLSRVGRQKLTLTRLNMNALVSDILSTLESQIKESKVRIEVSDLPPCKGDLTQINQVFTNLIENAIKYLNANREGRITISGEKQGKRTIYCIEDNGIGIAENHVDKIFEMFHQLDPSKKGTGLGLTIVKRILDKHGGSIHVESEAEKGSRFYVELPV